MKHEEAIKLKPGTSILIRSKVLSVDATGDIVYETRAHDQEYEVMHAKTDCQYVDVQTPEKKLDTYRLFKKGDKVRVVEWNGRDIARVGQIGYVVAKEYNSKVELAIDGWKSDVFYPACHLELITPVEELKPYYIEKQVSADNGIHFETISYEVKKDGVTQAAFFCYNIQAMTKEQAKKAAEAECTRLNEEWRKEQNND